MAPCSSSAQLGPGYVNLLNLNGVAPDQNSPAQDPPRGPATSIAPQPSRAPDNSTAPDSSRSPDSAQNFQCGPRPDDFSHIGGWTWDSSH
ncbi:hypothetical protein TWF281_005796 [Arthrobotrys megalospora]